MAITLNGNRIRGCARLLLCLALAVIMASGWICVAADEGEAQSINASGNLNLEPSVDPIRKNEGYSAVLYDNRSGLPTSEANAIAHTSDGFIWIGSYAGLIRYDGNTFERINPATGISNVRCLYVDSQDRLWIGTNDSGLFLMSEGSILNCNLAGEMKTASIRAIVEDERGTIYIGSTVGVATIDGAMALTVLADDRIAGQTIRDFRRGDDGVIYGLTLNGDLFTMMGGELRSFLGQDECRVKGVLSILPDPRHPGDLYLGTEESRVYYGSLERNFSSLGVKNIAPLSYTERFEYIGGEIWVCAGNGIGRLDAEGFRRMVNVPMKSSVGHVMTDYEGNLWFTSTRQGVMKIVPNQFSDLFERYDLPGSVVNSTCMYGQQLFIGTDTGLIVVENGKRLDSLPLTEAVTASGVELNADDLLSFLDGVRIRSVVRDGRGRLWIATWRRHGLLRYDQGRVMAFTQADGLFSEQVRLVSEYEDGSILVANTGGVNVIRDDRVIAGYGEKDGIEISEILTVTEGFNHEMILGSDGGGIYVLDGGVTRHIGVADGLNSEVILRVKRSRGREVYWIVTSNSLAFMTPDLRVTTVQQFPYPNNYDVYENSKGDVWVLSSNGIYVIPGETLLANGPVEPVFYGVDSGLPYMATANSFSEQTAGGDLYIAGSAGVVKVNMEEPFEDFSRLKVSLPFIDADGKRFYPDESGEFILPGNVRKLTIYPFVFNYSLIDLQVSYRLEGFDLADITVSRSKLTPVDYTNLRVGAFNFIMTVKDPAGHSEQVASFRIVKGKEITIGTVGTIMMICASLLLMGGMLLYTSPYRKRKRLEDRLFTGMFLSNAAMALGELLSYLLEYITVPFVRELMIAGNTVLFAALVTFPYLLLEYLDCRMCPDKARLRRRKLAYGVPCFLFFAVMLVNLKAGWIFSIGEENNYIPGFLDETYRLPQLLVLFYLLLSLFKLTRVNARQVAVGVLLIVARLALELWYPAISSMSFIYALMLVSMQLYMMYRPMNEVAL